MAMYFAKEAFKNQYEKLRYAGADGKKSLEQTSNLCVFLAFDMTEAALGKSELSLSAGEAREHIVDYYSDVTTFQEGSEHGFLLARDMGYLTYGKKSPKSIIGSNFLTKKVADAMGSRNALPYPGKQRGPAVLELWNECTKADDWESGLLSLLADRCLDEYEDGSLDLAPLIVFILRNQEFPDDVQTDTENVISSLLKQHLTEELADFLVGSVDFTEWNGWFAEEELFTDFDYRELLDEVPVPKDGGGNQEDAENDDKKKFPRNRIIYGAPGTGKSNKLKTESDGFEETRVMFHPDYTYSQFVGGYRPATLYRTPADGVEIFDGSGGKIERQLEPVIDYALASGPFLDVLVKALNDPSKNYLLLIEEINRANVAAVFGDVFQLLDRNDAGFSEYDVTPNREIGAFLKEAVKNFSGKMQLPDNMYIWATMNSADQGVFPMDSAFKRRWSFEYLPLNQPKQDALLHNLELTFLGKKYYWVPFRKALNAFLTEKAKVSEDKLLGAFYMKKSELSNPDAIKNKLLLYLREDVLRHNAKALFEKPTFSQIAEAYDKADGGLFNAAFIEILNEANRTYTPDSTPPAAVTDVEDEDAAEAEE